MAKALPGAERWEDPIVAEVRKAREQLFAAAGYDLEELCRQLNNQQKREGRRAVTRSPRKRKGEPAKGRPAVPGDGLERAAPDRQGPDQDALDEAGRGWRLRPAGHGANGRGI